MLLRRIKLPLLLALLFGLTLKASALDSQIATRTQEEQKTIDVYKRANQAVVFITTRSYVVDPLDFFQELRPQEGTGTGTIINAKQGLVLTNLHVIQSVLRAGGTVEIMLASGQNSSATLLGFDRNSDLAVFKLKNPPADLVDVPLGDSSKLEVGQRVLAIGNPFGLYRSLTAGLISSLERTMKTPESVILKDLIQTDAAINPGNSGGPLLDADGRLIGINTAILSQSGDSAGIGFAVPVNSIKRILPELIASGHVLRPEIGWQLVDTDQGPMVLRILPNSPAAEAGAQPIERPTSGVFLQGFRRDIDRGDLIFKVNGRKVSTKDDVEDIVLKNRGESPIVFTMRQGGIRGAEREVVITPERK